MMKSASTIKHAAERMRKTDPGKRKLRTFGGSNPILQTTTGGKVEGSSRLTTSQQAAVPSASPSLSKKVPPPTPLLHSALSFVDPTAALWANPRSRPFLLSQGVPPVAYASQCSSTVRLRPSERNQPNERNSEVEEADNQDTVEEDESLVGELKDEDTFEDESRDDVTLVYHHVHNTKIIDTSGGATPYTSSSYLLFTEAGGSAVSASSSSTGFFTDGRDTFGRRVGYGCGVRKEGHSMVYQGTKHLPDPASNDIKQLNATNIGVTTYTIQGKTQKAKVAMRNLASAVADDELLEKAKDIRPFFASQRAFVKAIARAAATSPSERDALVAIPSLSEQQVAAYMQFIRGKKLAAFALKSDRRVASLIPFHLVEASWSSVIPNQYLVTENEAVTSERERFDPRQIESHTEPGSSTTINSGKIKQFYLLKSALLRKRLVEHKKFLKSGRSSADSEYDASHLTSLSEDELLKDRDSAPRARNSDVHAVLTLVPVTIVGLGANLVDEAKMQQSTCVSNIVEALLKPIFVDYSLQSAYVTTEFAPAALHGNEDSAAQRKALTPKSLFDTANPSDLLAAAYTLSALAHEESLLNSTKNFHKPSQTASSNFYGPNYLRVPYISDVVLTENISSGISKGKQPLLDKEALATEIIGELARRQQSILQRIIHEGIFGDRNSNDSSRISYVVGDDDVSGHLVPPTKIEVHMPGLAASTKEGEILDFITHASGESFSIAPGREMVYACTSSSNPATSVSVLSDLATGQLFTGNSCGRRVWWGGTALPSASKDESEDCFSRIAERIANTFDATNASPQALRSRIKSQVLPLSSTTVPAAASGKARKAQLEFIKSVADGGEILTSNGTSFFVPPASTLFADSYGDLAFSTFSGIDSDGSVTGNATNSTHTRRVGVMDTLNHAIADAESESNVADLSSGKEVPTRTLQLRDISDVIEGVQIAEEIMTRSSVSHATHKQPTVVVHPAITHLGKREGSYGTVRSAPEPYFGKIVEDYAFDRPFFSRDAAASSNSVVDALLAAVADNEETWHLDGKEGATKSPPSQGVAIFAMLLKQKLFEASVPTSISAALLESCELRAVDAKRFLEMTEGDLLQFQSVAARRAAAATQDKSSSTNTLEVLTSLQRALRLATR